MWLLLGGAAVITSVVVAVGTAFSYYTASLPENTVCYHPSTSSELIRWSLTGCWSPVACDVYAGMGCVLFYRRRHLFAPVEAFFLAHDCQGQYGKDDRPATRAFLKGYRMLKLKRRIPHA